MSSANPKSKTVQECSGVCAWHRKSLRQQTNENNRGVSIHILVASLPDTKQIPVTIIVFNPPCLAINTTWQNLDIWSNTSCPWEVPHKLSDFTFAMSFANGNSQPILADHVKGFCRAWSLLKANVLPCVYRFGIHAVVLGSASKAAPTLPH